MFIPDNVGQALLNYLGEQRYNDVAPLIAELYKANQQVPQQPEKDNKEEKKEDKKDTKENKDKKNVKRVK